MCLTYFYRIGGVRVCAAIVHKVCLDIMHFIQKIYTTPFRSTMLVVPMVISHPKQSYCRPVIDYIQRVIDILVWEIHQRFQSVNTLLLLLYI